MRTHGPGIHEGFRGPPAGPAIERHLLVRQDVPLAPQRWGHAGSDSTHMEDFHNPDGTMRSADDIAALWRHDVRPAHGPGIHEGFRGPPAGPAIERHLLVRQDVPLAGTNGAATRTIRSPAASAARKAVSNTPHQRASPAGFCLAGVAVWRAMLADDGDAYRQRLRDLKAGGVSEHTPPARVPSRRRALSRSRHPL
jgi:hypothetical protein